MKRIIVLLCTTALCTGCSTYRIADSSITEFSTENQTETTDEKNAQSDEIIDADKAAQTLSDKLHVDETEQQHLSYEGTALLEQRSCYIFRLYEDYSSHRVTLGWYAVDMRTGECFDTNVLTELTPLGEITTGADNWQDAYKQVLYAFMQTDAYSEEYSRFSLYDISADGIPELILSEDTTHLAQCDVYTFDNGLISLGKRGTYGEIGYYPDKNAVVTYDLAQGYEYTGFSRIEDNEMIPLMVFYNNKGVAEPDAVTYEIDDFVVSKEAYDEAMQEQTGETYISLGSDYRFDEIENVLTE